MHWWKILKEEPKWCAQFEEKKKDKTEIVDVPDVPLFIVRYSSCHIYNSHFAGSVKMVGLVLIFTVTLQIDCI